MQKDVLIRIKGSILSENGLPDLVELETEGRYSRRGGSYYITYRESEATGMEGVTTTLKVEDAGRVTLIRGGSQRSRLILEQGQRHQSLYDTGYGALLVGISGCKVDSKLSPVGGELSFHYNLDINSNLVSRNEVYVQVREADTKDVSSN